MIFVSFEIRSDWIVADDDTSLVVVGVGDDDTSLVAVAVADDDTSLVAVVVADDDISLVVVVVAVVLVDDGLTRLVLVDDGLSRLAVADDGLSRYVAVDGVFFVRYFFEAVFYFFHGQYLAYICSKVLFSARAAS